ncbi:MAG: DUF3226 domain-containing protein [Pseudothermotoga sp.]
MNDKITIEKPNLIIVEGKDDKSFLQNILVTLGMEDCQIQELNGKDNLHRILPALSKTPGFEDVKSLAIFLDADLSPSSTLQSIQNALSKTKLPVPRNPGEVKSDGKIKIGVFLFPDCKNNGTVEDLIIKTLDKQFIECIQHYHNCVKQTAKVNWEFTSKSILYSYFAVQKEPARTFDVALKRGHVNLYSPEFDAIRDFLKKLFSHL